MKMKLMIKERWYHFELKIKYQLDQFTLKYFNSCQPVTAQLRAARTHGDNVQTKVISDVVKEDVKVVF